MQFFSLIGIDIHFFGILRFMFCEGPNKFKNLPGIPPAPTKRPDRVALVQTGGVRSTFCQRVFFFIFSENLKYRKVIDKVLCFHLTIICPKHSPVLLLTIFSDGVEYCSMRSNLLSNLWQGSNRPSNPIVRIKVQLVKNLVHLPLHRMTICGRSIRISISGISQILKSRTRTKHCHWHGQGHRLCQSQEHGHEHWHGHCHCHEHKRLIRTRTRILARRVRFVKNKLGESASQHGHARNRHKHCHRHMHTQSRTQTRIRTCTGLRTRPLKLTWTLARPKTQSQLGTRTRAWTLTRPRELPWIYNTDSNTDKKLRTRRHKHGHWHGHGQWHVRSRPRTWPRTRILYFHTSLYVQQINKRTKCEPSQFW